MAKVIGPFFSTWASGSISHSLTCRDNIKNCNFVIQAYTLHRGRPTEKQRIIRRQFGDRLKSLVKARCVLSGE